MTPPALTGAWQAALASEQRARFGYGVLGPRLTGAAADLARAAQSSHEQLIADTATAMTAVGVQPGPPAADYPDLYPDSSPGSAARLAIRLEQDAARAWRFLYSTAATGPTPSAAADQSVRTLAQRALTDTAVRATQWRLKAQISPAVQPFPGI